jgi:hypothetical protein
VYLLCFIEKIQISTKNSCFFNMFRSFANRWRSKAETADRFTVSCYFFYCSSQTSLLRSAFLHKTAFSKINRSSFGLNLAFCSRQRHEKRLGRVAAFSKHRAHFLEPQSSKNVQFAKCYYHFFALSSRSVGNTNRFTFLWCHRVSD